MVFPTETSTSYVELVPLKPLDLRAFTLCMRVATELKGEREVILLAYRTEDHDELNVWRELDGRFVVPSSQIQHHRWGYFSGSIASHSHIKNLQTLSNSDLKDAYK